MESQIATGVHHGPGLDVPEQGLHLRRPNAGPWRGTLDTSMGAVPVEAVEVPADDMVSPGEVVIAVSEQFVGLTSEGDRMTGRITTDAGTIAFSTSGHGNA